MLKVLFDHLIDKMHMTHFFIVISIFFNRQVNPNSWALLYFHVLLNYVFYF